MEHAQRYRNQPRGCVPRKGTTKLSQYRSRRDVERKRNYAEYKESVAKNRKDEIEASVSNTGVIIQPESSDSDEDIDVGFELSFKNGTTSTDNSVNTSNTVNQSVQTNTNTEDLGVQTNTRQLNFSGVTSISIDSQRNVGNSDSDTDSAWEDEDEDRCNEDRSAYIKTCVKKLSRRRFLHKLCSKLHKSNCLEQSWHWYYSWPQVHFLLQT